VDDDELEYAVSVQDRKAGWWPSTIKSGPWTLQPLHPQPSTLDPAPWIL